MHIHSWANQTHQFNQIAAKNGLQRPARLIQYHETAWTHRAPTVHPKNTMYIQMDHNISIGSSPHTSSCFLLLLLIYFHVSIRPQIANYMVSGVSLESLYLNIWIILSKDYIQSWDCCPQGAEKSQRFNGASLIQRKNHSSTAAPCVLYIYWATSEMCC